MGTNKRRILLTGVGVATVTLIFITVLFFYLSPNKLEYPPCKASQHESDCVTEILVRQGGQLQLRDINKRINNILFLQKTAILWVIMMVAISLLGMILLIAGFFMACVEVIIYFRTIQNLNNGKHSVNSSHIKATVKGLTITTPLITSVLLLFVFAVFWVFAEKVLPFMKTTFFIT